MSSPSSSKARSTRSTGNTPKSCQRNHRLVEVLRVGRAMHAGFRDRAHIETPFGFAHGHGMRAGTLADLTLHRGGDVVDRVANCGDHLADWPLPAWRARSLTPLPAA